MPAILRNLLFFLLCLSAMAQGGSPLKPECGQLMVVISPDWDNPKALLQRFERHGGDWHGVGTPIPVVLGASGLGWGLGEHPPQSIGPQKKEGDGKAPAGVFALTQLWLRPGITAPATGGFETHRIQPDTIAIDDPASRLYNRIIPSNLTHEPDWRSWEKMDISDYDRVLVVAHNLSQPIPGRGSCIFVHRWETPSTPTSGCTAMEEKNLVEVIGWLRPAQNPRLVQLPAVVAEEWRGQGWIPPASSK